jgi:hypothetical protein
MRNRPFPLASGPHARNCRSCHSSGQWGTAALSACAASTYPYAALARLLRAILNSVCNFERSMSLVPCPVSIKEAKTHAWVQL